MAHLYSGMTVEELIEEFNRQIERVNALGASPVIMAVEYWQPGDKVEVWRVLASSKLHGGVGYVSDRMTTREMEVWLEGALAAVGDGRPLTG